MKKLFSKYTSLILLSLAFTGCSDLTEEPFTFVSPQGFYRNAEDLDKALTGVYASYQNHYGRGSINYFMILESMSELGAPARTKDNPHLYNVWADVNNASTSISKWRGSYEIINAANVVLGRGKDIEMDEALKTRMFAEARFLRGLTYFNLVRLYGGVAIPESFTEGLEGLEIPRKTSEETFDYLIADLQFAAENLTVKSALSNELWRASKGAAQAFLGKAYLYRASLTNNAAFFEESRKYSEMVVNSKEYNLEPDFKNLWFWWNVKAKNGQESIFEIQFGNKSGEDNQLHINGGINITDAGLGSYMFHRHGPSFTAYNSFSETDARKAATFLTEVKLVNGSTITWLEADQGNYPGSKGWPSAGPGNLKYFDRSTESASLGLPGANVYAMRFAEVLLNYAEAVNELSGPTAAAYEALNKVRTRAKLPALTGLTKAQFAEAVYRERGWEFIGEGQVYYDGIRTNRIGKAVQEEVAYGVKNKTFLYTDLLYVPTSKFLWKIPVFDLDSNPALVQNPDNQ